MADLQYVVGAELPRATFAWRDADRNLIDFSSGWTFSLRLERGGQTVLDKTTSITGSSTDPNIIVVWASGELAGLEPGIYAGQIWARRTSDSLDRVLTFSLQMLAAVASLP